VELEVLVAVSGLFYLKEGMVFKLLLTAVVREAEGVPETHLMEILQQIITERAAVTGGSAGGNGAAGSNQGGSAGGVPGGGGGGAWGTTTSVRVGGFGAAGQVILTYTVGVLPVELTSFSASNAGNSINLKWHTANEVNNYGFNVERSLQSQEPQKIAFVKGHGNSNSPKSYSFVDATAPVGNITYSLEQIDNNGTAKIIGTTKVTVAAPTVFALKQNYPNPFNPTTIINYELPMNSHVTLKVYDVLGKEVATVVNTTQNAGSYSINFATNKYGMSSGIYFYRLDAGNYTEMKKMVVIK
jgi:hypothetical protein